MSGTKFWVWHFSTIHLRIEFFELQFLHHQDEDHLFSWITAMFKGKYLAGFSKYNKYKIDYYGMNGWMDGWIQTIQTRSRCSGVWGYSHRLTLAIFFLEDEEVIIDFNLWSNPKVIRILYKPRIHSLNDSLILPHQPQLPRSLPASCMHIGKEGNYQCNQHVLVPMHATFVFKILSSSPLLFSTWQVCEWEAEGRQQLGLEWHLSLIN